jgi:lysophospholipase L1-like esterase
MHAAKAGRERERVEPFIAIPSNDADDTERGMWMARVYQAAQRLQRFSDSPGHASCAVCAGLRKMTACFSLHRTRTMALTIAKRFCCLLGVALFLSGCNGLIGAEQDKTEARQEKKNSATTPMTRDAKWIKRHDDFVEIAKKADVDLLFQGDSITDRWRTAPAKTAWDQYFAPFRVANFGIDGDRTENVLWRLQNGELDGIQPKVVVLMIGTNNAGRNSAEQIAAGVAAIVKLIHEKSPQTKVLLLAVFPRAEKSDSPLRIKVKAINEIIAKFDDGDKTVRYLDIGAKFLQPDGTLSREIMPDLLHLSAEGYLIWGKAIIDDVKQLMAETAKKNARLAATRSGARERPRAPRSPSGRG